MIMGAKPGDPFGLLASRSEEPSDIPIVDVDHFTWLDVSILFVLMHERTPERVSAVLQTNNERVKQTLDFMNKWLGIPLFEHLADVNRYSPTKAMINLAAFARATTYQAADAAETAFVKEEPRPEGVWAMLTLLHCLNPAKEIPATVSGYIRETSHKFIQRPNYLSANSTQREDELRRLGYAEYHRQMTGPDSDVEKLLAKLADALNVPKEQLDNAVAPFRVVEDPAPPLPKRARILYAKRQKDKSLAGTGIIEFLRAVYGPWLNGALSRPDLKRLDPKAYEALANWLRTNKLPSDIRLPTKSEVVDTELRKRLISGGPKRPELASAAYRRLRP